jgi:hypothetical protein
MKREIEAIRKRGHPASALELDLWYKQVSAEKNAALRFSDAFASLRAFTSKKGSNGNLASIFEEERLATPIPDTLAEEIEGHIEANSEALEILHAAAQLTESRYPINLAQGAATLLPHLANIKESARLLQLDAVLHSSKRDSAAAVRSLQTGFALARSLRNEPLLISELVRIASVSLLLQAMERVINEQILSEEQLVSLGATIRQCEEDGWKALQRAFIGERAAGISIFELSAQQLEQLGSGLTGSSYENWEEMFMFFAFSARRVSGMHDRDLLFFLESMGQLEEIATPDYPSLLDGAERTDAKIQAEVSRHPIKYMISRLLLPALTKASIKEATLASRLRSAEMALAIERHRINHSGALPSMEDLVPELLPTVPKDPFDHQPLQYEVLRPKGYRIVGAATAAEVNRGRASTNRLDLAFSVLR